MISDIKNYNRRYTRILHNCYNQKQSTRKRFTLKKRTRRNKPGNNYKSIPNPNQEGV
jgi:hypothetical protein